MAQLPVQFLHNDSITKDNLRCIINTTYEMFGNLREYRMRDALLMMIDTTPLIWVLRHFLRECDHHNWNLAVVFAERPLEFKRALEQNDIQGYYANAS